MPEPTLPKARKTALLPENDQQLAALALFAAGYWASQKWLTLRHMQTVAFQQLAANYSAAIASRQQAGSARPIDADELLGLDAQIDENLYRVKNRLIDKYDKKKAVAYYATVGIGYSNKSYTLPRERTKRAVALHTLVAGLATEGIAKGDYGTSFWEPIATRYTVLVKQLADANGAVAQAVGQKDTMRAATETVLSSLAKVLEGNYPDKNEYKAQLRAWGFQRETY